jgi:hypothetical protein
MLTHHKSVRTSVSKTAQIIFPQIVRISALRIPQPTTRPVQSLVQRGRNNCRLTVTQQGCDDQIDDECL